MVTEELLAEDYTDAEIQVIPQGKRLESS